MVEGYIRDVRSSVPLFLNHKRCVLSMAKVIGDNLRC